MTDEIEYRTIEGATWDDVQDGDRVTYIWDSTASDPIVKVERPVPKVDGLPTEPGYYLDKGGIAWELGVGRGQLDPDYAPYSRLHTLSDAAEIIADWVEGTGWRGPQMIRRGFVDGAK